VSRARILRAPVHLDGGSLRSWPPLSAAPQSVRLPGLVGPFNGGLKEAGQDDNAVIFTRKQQDEFDALRSALESAM
jgi:hypothetical protein